MPSEPLVADETQQAEDNEVAELRAMLETYRCDHRIPKSAFVGLLATVALQQFLEQEK